MSGYKPIDPPTPGTAPSRLRYLPVGVGAIFLGLCALYTGNSFFTQDDRSVLLQIPAENFQAVPQVQTQTQAQPQVQLQDPSADKAVEAILANLTVAQKVGQMLQVDVGTILRGSRNPHIALNKPVVRRFAKLGIGSYFNSPFDRSSSHALWTASEWKNVIDEINAIYAKENAVPMIYGIDTVHGANYVRGATLFPQPLACASSFNPDLVYRMGEIEAKDSLAAGLAWIFSPIIGIAMHPKWARNYETFGEDPYLVTQLGVAAIRGIQANKRAAASMKHFIAYSNPTSGNDRTDSVVSDFELLNYFSPSFLAAVKEGQVKTAMETYTSVNGEPVLASHKLLDDLLRHDMGFDGLLVSDDDEFHRLVAEHHVATNDKDAIYMVFNHTSLDMNMVPYKGIQDRITERLVARGELTEARLDESVRRILRLKYDLGLFNKSQTPFVPPTAVGSIEDQREAKAMADEAIILLKNGPKTPVDAVNPKHVLPIEDPHATVFLTGPLADSKAFLCGGWTIVWQGTRNSSQISHGISIREGLNRSFANLQYAEGVDTNGRAVEKRTELLAKAATSSYTIVVIGEAPYAEKTGDIDNLALPEGQLEYVRQLTAINTTNVIVIVVEGRPRLLNGITNDAAAVLLSFLPCEQGGEAFADILTGRVNPSAKLPITYPKNSGNVHLPYFHRINTECRDEFAECEMEWTFGSGLSYTSFKYGKITLSQHNVSASGTLTVSVPVTNTGARAGKETVLLFISQKVRHKYVPETKLLKKFQKISLQPQQTTVMNFTLTAADWSYYEPQIGQGFKTVVDPGVFHVQIKHDTDCSKAAKVYKAYEKHQGAQIFRRKRFQPDQRRLHCKHANAPPFLAAVKEGKVLTAMETCTSVNGEPVLASKKLLSDLIRNDMGFDGLLVTDADEVNRLIDEHHIANDEKDALYMVFNQTSLDMNMIMTVETLDNANGANLGVLADLVKGKEGHANAIKTTVELVNEGLLTKARLDESVRRILQLKYDLGRFSKSKTAYVPPTPIGSPEDQRDAKAMADEAIILLKNEPVTISGDAKPKQVLPIEDAEASIFLTGPLADSKAYLCGGWSLFWQGTDNSSMFKHGVSIRDGLSKSFANVDFAAGVDVNGKAVEDRATVLAKAAKSEYTIVVIGEHGYAEKTGDIDNLDLAEGQLEYVRQLTALNSTKVILVIVSGRTRLLNGVTKDAAAVLLSFLPCEQGGEAFADVISGLVNPSAKLPLTYPKNSGNTHLPYYHRVNTACRDEFAECEMEWKFGSGLSYTTFEYGKVTLSQENVTSSGYVTVSVPVTNTGARAGKEAVLLFISQKVSHKYVPETKHNKVLAQVVVLGAIRVVLDLDVEHTRFRHSLEALAHLWRVVRPVRRRQGEVDNRGFLWLQRFLRILRTCYEYAHLG